MRLVDKIAEVVRRSKAARHRIIASRLIAPRSIEGMFAERHELNVRIVHIGDVLDECIGKIAV